jgi:hypothetical protein
MLLRPAATLSDAVDGAAFGHGLVVTPVPTETWHALGARARRCGITRTTLSWLAAARAIRTMSNGNGSSSPIRILGPVDLRATLGVPNDALQNWLGTIEHDVDPTIDPRQLHTQLRRDREEGRALATPLVVSALAERLPPRVATALFRFVDSDRWPTTHTLLLTHLRPRAETWWPTALAPRRLWCTSLLPRKPAIGLTVTALGGVVTAAASWRPADLRRATVEAFLARWLAFLTEDT